MGGDCTVENASNGVGNRLPSTVMGLFMNLTKGFVFGATVAGLVIDPRRFLRKTVAVVFLVLGVLSYASVFYSFRWQTSTIVTNCLIAGVVIQISAAKFVCIRPFNLLQLPGFVQAAFVKPRLVPVTIVGVLAGIGFPLAAGLVGFTPWWTIPVSVAGNIAVGWAIARVDARKIVNISVLAVEIGRIVGVDPESFGLEITGGDIDPLYTLYFPMLIQGQALEKVVSDIQRLLPGITVEAATEQGVDVRTPL